MKGLKFILLQIILVSGLFVFPSCKNNDASPQAEICNDGIDNDGDGFTDCDDNDCTTNSTCAVEICNDGIDNDNDGFTDCADNDCTSSPDCL